MNAARLAAALLLGLSLAASPHAVRAIPQEPPDGTATRLGARLEELRAQHGVPALAAALVYDGRLAWVRATGLRKAGGDARVTDFDPFHMGSIAKVFSAALAALMVEEGAIEWDRSLAKSYPELASTMRPEYRAVTLRELHAHLSGMPAAPRTEPGDEYSRVTRLLTGRRYEYVRDALKDAPEVPPRTKVHYGGGAIIGAAMLERATGKAWEVHMKREIFQALGLRGCGFGAASRPGRPTAPWEHVPGKDGRPQPVELPARYDEEPHAPAGRNVHCSAADLGRFMIAQLPRPWPDPKRFGAKALAVLHTPVAPGWFAPGWAVGEAAWAGGRTLGHGGSNGRNFALAEMAPAKNSAFVAMTNMGGKPASAAVNAMAEELRAVIGAFRPRGR